MSGGDRFEPADIDYVRARLLIWGIWIRNLPSYGPINKTATDIMFPADRQVGMNDILTPEVERIGEHLDRLLTFMPDYDRKALRLVYVKQHSLEVCADQLTSRRERVTRHSFERVLNIAHGRMSTLLAVYPEGG